MRVWGSHTNQSLVDSNARLHAELTGSLRQHCPICDERHLVLLGWMVTGLLLPLCQERWRLAIQTISITRGLDGTEQCVATARPSTLM